ncbi:MAG: flavin prenyltransferase UbiX [Planctomycetales bacterium]
MSNIVLGITGASGAPYAVRLLEVLLQAERHVHLVLSAAACDVFRAELQIDVDLAHFDPAQLLVARKPQEQGVLIELAKTYLHWHPIQDYGAGIASGSFPTAGMVICPCSMGTLGAIAAGLSTNLIQRAADVHLKEGRKLIVVPRETPLSTIHLQNMLRLREAGGIVLPAAPGFYNQPQGINDLVDFVVARICDQLGVPVTFAKRWGE